MKIRLRHQLPVRFKNAVTLARRALHCERLEPRSLLHGLPLAIDFGSTSSEGETDPPPVLAPVVQATTTDAPAGPACSGSNITNSANTASDTGDTTNSTTADSNTPSSNKPSNDASNVAATPDGKHDAADAQPVEGDANSGKQPSDESGEADDASDPADSGEDNGLPKPEGEAQIAPPPDNPVNPAVSNDAIGIGTGSTGVSDAYVSTPASASLGDPGQSVTGGHVSSAPGMQSAHGALTDNLVRGTLSDGAISEALNLSSDDAGNHIASGSNVDTSVGVSHSVGMALNLDVQARSLQVQSLQLQNVQLQRIASPSELAVSPLANSVKPAWGVVGTQAGIANDERFGRVVQAGDRDPAASANAPEREAGGRYVASTSPEGDEANSHYQLPAAIQLVSQERRAERAAGTSGMHADVARHAKRYIRGGYLRIRETSDGLVELAIEPAATNGQLDEDSSEQIHGTVQMDWGGESTGLYREFDLATLENDSSAKLMSLGFSATGMTGLGDSPHGAEAIDAAHAAENADGGEDQHLGQSTLPLGLLAISSLLAISRHRFARRLRQGDDE